MEYKDYIKSLTRKIPPSIVNLQAERKRGRAPTQAFSNFLTNSEQGDWAETLFFFALKKADIPYTTVRYGKSDKIIAGDPNFKHFYNSYQDELDSIGKRPDVLLFNPDEYKDEWGDDISQLPREKLYSIVPFSVAGFEVRSSAYLTKKFIPKKGRPFLSFTPKVEDLLIVLKWIDIFNIPHFYVQVFFDAIYIIPFIKILSLLQSAQIEERGRKNKKIIGRLNNKLAFVIEKNPKNQYKETIHIFLNQGYVLSRNVEEPELIPKRKKLAAGRLLHYVSFRGGKAKIDDKLLLNLIEKPF